MLRNKQVLITAIAGLALQGYAALVLADDDDGVKVVAPGLLSPRGLDFAPNGQLYVVEAGVQTTAAPCISTGMGSQCYTETGALTRVDSWGIHAPQQVASHLPTDDAIYVSNNGTSFGANGLYGEVLRIPLENDHYRHHDKD